MCTNFGVIVFQIVKLFNMYSNTQASVAFKNVY